MTRSNICLLSDVSILKKGGSVVAYVLPFLLGNKSFVLLQNMESLNPTPSPERIGPDDVELTSDGR